MKRSTIRATLAAAALGLALTGASAPASADHDDYPGDRYGGGRDGRYEQSYPPQQYYPPQNGYRRGYDRGRRGGYVISCASSNYRVSYCYARVRSHVELVYRHSKARCSFNRSWGYDRRGVWVSNGCRADFAIF